MGEDPSRCMLYSSIDHNQGSRKEKSMTSQECWEGRHSDCSGCDWGFLHLFLRIKVVILSTKVAEDPQNWGKLTLFLMTSACPRLCLSTLSPKGLQIARSSPKGQKSTLISFLDWCLDEFFMKRLHTWLDKHFVKPPGFVNSVDNFSEREGGMILFTRTHNCDTFAIFPTDFPSIL